MSILIIYGLIAHITADFYLQSSQLASLKKTSLKHQVLHAMIHLVLLLPLMVFNFSIYTFISILIITMSHLILDTIKSKYFRDHKSPLLIFTLDQLLHIVIIIVSLSYLLSPNNTDLLNMFKVLLAGLVLLRPIDILIEIIFSTLHTENNISASSASRWIGYIERLLYATLMILAMETFVAVFIGVKTASRWSAVQENKLFGLQFYIGTFISVLAGLIVGLLIKSIY